MKFPLLMILDGETRSSLGVVRSLGRRGIPIIVGSNSRLGRSGFSKYAAGRFHYPNIKEHFETAHSIIMDKVKVLHPDILMPIYDPGWELVYAHYEEYARLTTIVPNPGRQLFENLLNKAILADLAEQSGLPIPKTYRPQTKEEALAVCHEFPYPVLMKPRTNAAGKGIVKVVSAKEFPKRLHEQQPVPVIQEYFEGEDLELTIFSILGDAIAGSTYLSLRNSPLPYGPPVACITIKDEYLMELGIRFLKKLRYTGVAHLDFRRDLRDGQPKLLDFNARLAGTNEISTCSGIDFAHLQYLIASGRASNRCFESSTGLEFRWLLPGEIRHLLQTNHKWQTIRNLLKWRNVRIDFSADDLKPHVAMLLDALQRLSRKIQFQASSIDS